MVHQGKHLSSHKSYGTLKKKKFVKSEKLWYIEECTCVDLSSKGTYFGKRKPSINLHVLTSSEMKPGLNIYIYPNKLYGIFLTFIFF